jgi:hypothetical protein
MELNGSVTDIRANLGNGMIVLGVMVHPFSLNL